MVDIVGPILIALAIVLVAVWVIGWSTGDDWDDSNPA